MNLIQGLIGAMVAVIIGVGVVVPIAQDTVDNASLTGTSSTLAGYLPLLLIVVIVVAIVALIR